MVIMSVAGITLNQARNMPVGELDKLTTVSLAPEPMNQHDKRAIAVHSGGVKLGYVPCGMLQRAHHEGWVEMEWRVAKIGRITPRHAGQSQPYCNIVTTFAPVPSPKRRTSLRDRMTQDDSLYDGSTCVSIQYKSGKDLRWRDVVLLSKAPESFCARDGSCDREGRSIPQKRFAFENLSDAKFSLECWEDAFPRKKVCRKL